MDNSSEILILSILIYICYYHNVNSSHATNATTTNRCKWQNNFSRDVNFDTMTMLSCKLHRWNDILDSISYFEKDDITNLNVICSDMNFIRHDDESFINLINLEYFNVDSCFIPFNIFERLSKLSILNILNSYLNVNSDFLINQNNLIELNLINLNLSKISISSLYSLKKLNLSLNQIEHISDLDYLNNLEILDLSFNKIKNISILSTLKNLLHLFLQNNQQIVIQLDFFKKLPNLETLDLSKNQLELEHYKIFTGLTNLKYLNLKENEIKKLHEKIFNGMISLQHLNLEHNFLTELNLKTFSDLQGLITLNLAHNKIKIIQKNLFTSNSAMLQLNLDKNFIEKFLLKNLTSLVELTLNGNSLQEIPHSIQTFISLKSIDLGYNLIHQINKTNFKGLEQLMGLRLTGNLITSLRKDTFSLLNNLHVLNLASNQIKTIEKQTFSTKSQLRAIRLDSNKIDDISEIFRELPFLVWLNISSNNITWFDYSYMPQSLEWLDLNQNNITEMGNYFKTESFLSHLDISHNLLTNINPTTFPKTIKTLLLKNCLINEVSPGTLSNKPNLEKIDLTENLIKKLEMSSLILPNVNNYKNPPELLLTKNPLHCDCSMEWILKLKRLQLYPSIIDLNTTECTMELKRGSEKRIISTLKSSEFLCAYDTHCFALCHCCDFDACDCKMKCPVGCTCFHDHTWNSNVVNCEIAGYYKIPDKIPMDATEIYLDGNDFGELKSHLFIGKKKLEVLFMNNSNVQSINNRTFIGLPSLKLLRLEYNHITEIVGNEFNQLGNLNELYLDHNKITSIDKDTFINLKKLIIITLGYNKIISLNSIEYLFQLPGPTNELFQGNPWKCDCNFVDNFNNQSILLKNLPSSNKIYCSSGFSLEKESIKCDIRVTTTPTSFYVLQHRLIGSEYIPIAAAVIVSILGIVLIITLIFTLRNKAHLWIHENYGIRVLKDTTTIDDIDDEKKIYDAHIIYSQGDSDFTYRIIAADLNSKGYKLNLDNSQSDVMLTSKKLIILLTINFLQNWTSLKFRTTIEKITNSIKTTQRKHKIIIIIAAPLELILVDPSLEILLKNSTPIFWGEKKFWSKLKFGMPDLEFHHHHKSFKRKDENSSYYNQNTGHLYSTINECTGDGSGGNSSGSTTTNGRAYFV